tara:strand:- start:641 stop:1747 length:1107 start_codon:yes stop_codon:yes gene_type:complete
MKINGKNWKTIWITNDLEIEVIDQTLLPHKFKIKKFKNIEDTFFGIKNMIVRGAPLIGVAGGYGFALGIKEDSSDENLLKCSNYLKSARPTAVNLSWAIDRIYKRILEMDKSERFEAAIKEAKLIETEDILMCSKIGDNGLKVIKEIYQRKNYGSDNKPQTFNVLTHCNAGWLATVDWGTALAPIYKAHREKINIHVWVDETRPRNQGASLTSFELQSEGISHSVIVDNAGGYLMQKGMVDMVIVGSDRTTSSGDVCNKIGTYLKALAAYHNNIPFYAALPFSTIDWSLEDGVNSIPIEERSHEEVDYINGLNDNGDLQKIRITPLGSKSFNPAFDVTPSKFISGIITEKGICKADKESLKSLYSQLM